MYNNPSAPMAAGGAAALAVTGANIVWIVLAAFALIAVGTAIARIAPRTANSTPVNRNHWK